MERRLINVSDFPIIGSIAFGLIDRGTNLIQVRPSSMCMLSCIFCSTDAGPKSSNRISEYIVDLDVLVEGFREVVKFKGAYRIEAHIDTVGDPTLYPRITDLIQELSSIRGVEVVSMQTHGYALTEEMIDDMAESGLSRINLSIDALNPKTAVALSGTEWYSVDKIKNIAEYIIKNTDIDLLIAPVWVPRCNDDEIPEIIKYGLKIGCGRKWPPFGIQKYEAHKYGRKPKNSRPMSWFEFYSKLKQLEKIYNTKLILRREDFNIHPRRRIKYPFSVGEKLYVETIDYGWLKNEKLAIARDRVITIVNADNIPLNVEVKVEIIRVKDNIIIAKPTI